MDATTVSRSWREGVWTLSLPETMFVTEASSLLEAATEMLSFLRDYAADWNDHLHRAPNHVIHQDLVVWVDERTDEQLIAWLRGRR